MANETLGLVRDIRRAGFTITESKKNWMVRPPGENRVIATFTRNTKAHGIRKLVLHQIERAGFTLNGNGDVQHAVELTTHGEARLRQGPGKGKRTDEVVEGIVRKAEEAAQEKPDPLPQKDGWYTITPEAAVELLCHNTINRLRSPKTVEKYARIMKLGKWMKSGQPIIRSRAGTAANGREVPKGTILNGQHQLAACFEAEVAFEVYVINDVDPAAYVVMDSGKKRSYGDTVGIDGLKHARNRAGTASLICQYESRVLERNMSPTIEEIRDCLDRNEGIMNAVEKTIAGRHLMPTSALAFLYFVCSRYDREKADVFFEQLISGEEVKRGSVIAIYRRQMERRTAAKAKTHRIEYLAVGLKAFKYFCKGKTVETLRWRSAGAMAEGFPYLEDVD